LDKTCDVVILVVGSGNTDLRRYYCW